MRPVSNIGANGLNTSTYMSAPKTCNNRRQIEIVYRHRVPRARPNRQIQLDEQPATTSENKKITLIYRLQ
nr:hypothetical protein [Tanacetum cinerariifolium]